MIAARADWLLQGADVAASGYTDISIHFISQDLLQGLIVAFAHGSERFVIRFEEPSVAHADLSNTNAWADFSGEVPKLRDRINQSPDIAKGGPGRSVPTDSPGWHRLQLRKRSARRTQ